jgi:hypothetical protein
LLTKIYCFDPQLLSSPSEELQAALDVDSDSKTAEPNRSSDQLQKNNEVNPNQVGVEYSAMAELPLRENNDLADQYAEDFSDMPGQQRTRSFRFEVDEEVAALPRQNGGHQEEEFLVDDGLLRTEERSFKETNEKSI